MKYIVAIIVICIVLIVLLPFVIFRVLWEGSIGFFDEFMETLSSSILMLFDIEQ